jgi:hypothetical protein
MANVDTKFHENLFICSHVTCMEVTWKMSSLVMMSSLDHG